MVSEPRAMQFPAGAGALGNRRFHFAQHAALVADVVLERRAGAVRAPGLAIERLVEVDVAFHQWGGEQLVLAVDVAGGQWSIGGRAALGELAVFDQQVFGGGAVGADVSEPAGAVIGTSFVLWIFPLTLALSRRERGPNGGY